MPPAYVKPYVKRGKTDVADAEAITAAIPRALAASAIAIPVAFSRRSADSGYDGVDGEANRRAAEGANYGSGRNPGVLLGVRLCAMPEDAKSLRQRARMCRDWARVASSEDARWRERLAEYLERRAERMERDPENYPSDAD
jgi:hypothetical protein